MQCEQAQRALSDERYSASEDADALLEHLAGCAQCRALQAQHAALDRVLALDLPAATSADFDARFFGRLELERELERARARRKRRFAIGAALLPIAAAVAIVVLHKQQAAPEPLILAQLPAGDVDLALDLDLVEDLDVVEHLDEIEAYEEIGNIDDAEFDRILEETR